MNYMPYNFFSTKGRQSLRLWTLRSGNNKDQAEDYKREKQ